MANNLKPTPYDTYFGERRLHEHWVSFLVFGILLALLGVLAIFGANFVTLATIFFFGTLLIVSGILEILASFWSRKWPGFGLSLLSGVFYTTVGILMLSYPIDSALALSLLFAAFFAVSGIFKILFSLTAPVMQWGWALLSGVVSLALGIIIWANWPPAGLFLIGLLIGIDLLFIGLHLVMLSLAAKKEPIVKL
jgi:uncharacterized membrane protein HdeD (DUF308 family)